MKRIIGLFIIMLVALSSLNAQDFQCSVSINANQISSSGNQQRYNEMRQKLYTFVHDRKWCQYNLKQNERIECSITINLTKESGDEYEGTATLVLQRPVYKASYKTTLLSFQDKKVKFRYTGTDIDAILDRLPTARILDEEGGAYIVSAEVFGSGIDMWLRSQGSYVELLQ